jgi:hypothetical protein
MGPLIVDMVSEGSSVTMLIGGALDGLGRRASSSAFDRSISCRVMNGFLKDGPAAGQVVDAGDPPMRRGVIVLGDFGEDAHRYYLCSVDPTGAVYTHVGKVSWPPEAGPQVIRQPPAELVARA